MEEEVWRRAVGQRVSSLGMPGLPSPTCGLFPLYVLTQEGLGRGAAGGQPLVQQGPAEEDIFGMLPWGHKVLG